MLQTNIVQASAKRVSMQKILGNAGAPGLAHGNIVILRKGQTSSQDRPALLSLAEARKKCVKQSEHLYQRAFKDIGKTEAKIFRVYTMLLKDNYLFAPMKARIAKGESAENAIRQECEKAASKFTAMKQEYMRQRADDIRNVGNMVIDTMNGVSFAINLPKENGKIILVAFKLTPADTMLLEKNRIGGFITEQGGATSHSVILARTMNVPAVTGVKNVLTVFRDGEDAILDGTSGTVILNPDKATCRNFLTRQRTQKHLQKIVDAFRADHAVTLDGVSMKLCANIGNPADMKLLEGKSYDGVGLFRTEFLYSSFSSCPTVEQQANAYRQVFEMTGDREVIVRTADIGGDKAIPYLKLPKEDNPFLGNRGLRLWLERRKLFSEQLQAILTASTGRSISIMLPMVTERFELCEAKDELRKAADILKKNGMPCCKSVKLGIMVETPSAAIMAESFSSACDFMSIGTNDLTQYMTAADRGNPAVQKLYNPYNPAVVRTLANIAKAGQKTGTEVCVCGELAGDLSFLPILVGFGIRKFSAAPSRLKQMRFYLCHLKLSDAKKLAEKVLTLENSTEIIKCARKFYGKRLESF